MTSVSDFNLFIIIVVLYVAILIASMSDIFSLFFSVKVNHVIIQHTSTVNKSNCTKVVNNRFKSIHNEFEYALTSGKKWSILRKTSDVTIEKSKAETGGPDYIRTIASFDVSPQLLIQLFEWENFGNTQSKIDPFYEGSSLVSSSSKEFKLIRKTSKRPLFYPKRLFTFAMTETYQKNSIKTNDIPINNNKSNLLSSIPKGTPISLFTTVNLDKDIYPVSQKDNGYVKAYQDFLAWFIDDKKGGTILLIVMKVDLGSDIPKWAFLATVGSTGIYSMKALMSLSSKAVYKERKNNKYFIDLPFMKF